MYTGQENTATERAIGIRSYSDTYRVKLWVLTSSSRFSLRWTESIYLDIGYRINAGTTATAIGDSFGQFGFFGSLFFFGQGWLFRKLWIRALSGDQILDQALYIGLIGPAMTSVTHSTSWFVQGAFVVFLSISAGKSVSADRRLVSQRHLLAKHRV